MARHSETARERFERNRATSTARRNAQAERDAERDADGVGVVTYNADTDAGEGMGAERFGVRVDGRYPEGHDYNTHAEAIEAAEAIRARRTSRVSVSEADGNATAARAARIAAVRAYIRSHDGACPNSAETRARAFASASAGFAAMAERNAERMPDGCKRNYIGARNSQRAADALAQSATFAWAEADHGDAQAAEAFAAMDAAEAEAKATRDRVALLERAADAFQTIADGLRTRGHGPEAERAERDAAALRREAKV